MPMIDLALYEFNYSFTVLYYLTIYRETAGQVSVLFSYQSLRIESNVHRRSVVTFWSVFDNFDSPSYRVSYRVSHFIC